MVSAQILKLPHDPGHFRSLPQNGETREQQPELVLPGLVLWEGQLLPPASLTIRKCHLLGSGLEPPHPSTPACASRSLRTLGGGIIPGSALTALQQPLPSCALPSSLGVTCPGFADGGQPGSSGSLRAACPSRTPGPQPSNGHV